MSAEAATPAEGTTVETTATETPEQTFAIEPKYIEDGKILGRYSSTVELLEAIATGEAAPAPAGETVVAPDAGAGAVATDPSGVPSLQVPETPETPSTPGLAPEALARYEQEAISGGALSEKSLAELEAAGYPRQMATTHVQGLLAMRDAAAAKVAAAVGGTETVNAALKWAASNKSPEEIKGINASLNASDPATQALIIKGLVRESGAVAPVINGSDAPVLTSQPYPSEAQWKADLADPRYSKDPAFRQQVLNRTRATDLAGGYKS